VGSLDWEKEIVSKSHIAGKIPSRRKRPEALSCMESRKAVGKMLKVEDGTCAPKPEVFIGGTLKW